MMERLDESFVIGPADVADPGEMQAERIRD
jgi:hypothetical protein